MEHDGAGVIIKKMRLRMCKQAFARYLSQCKLQRQEEQTERRCDHYLQMRSDRNKRRIFNAFLRFTTEFGIAKRNLKVLYSNADIWLKRRGFLRWSQKAKVKKI